MEYISGYLARKFNKKGFDLGDYSYKLERTDNPSYVQRLSKGGLTVPNQGWLKLCGQLMHLFKKLNGDSFKYQLSTMKKLTELIVNKHPELDMMIINPLKFLAFFCL